MDRPRRQFARLALLATALAFGCAGPRVAAPVEGVPVCADFTTHHAKMEGSLRHPVRMRVLDGKNVLFDTLITGLRRPDAPKLQTYIPDDNARYTVEWTQCKNERAPHPVGEHAPSKGRDRAHEPEGTSYECGEANVYKKDTLETKKGDKASHVITFAPPPEPECWTGEPEAPAPAVAADAGAPPNDAGSPAAGNADAGTVSAGDAGTPAVGDAGAAPLGDAGAPKTK